MPQINNDTSCTLSTCLLSHATVNYVPSLVGNALFVTIYGLLFLIHGLLLRYYRTWSYSGAMLVGFVLEIVGYMGRVQMHFNPFNSNPFLIYLICITIAPVFFTAAIHLALSRVIVRYGCSHSRFSPKTISLTFITADFLALVLQAVGGAVADTASTSSLSTRGTYVLFAGLALQMLALAIFFGLALDFVLKVHRERMVKANIGEAGLGSSGSSDVEHGYTNNGVSEPDFEMFLMCFATAILLILIRAVFRVAEVARGFAGRLANEEVPFMLLEGAAIIVTTTVMTVCHPGWVFGGTWHEAGWTWRSQKGRLGTDDAEYRLNENAELEKESSENVI